MKLGEQCMNKMEISTENWNHQERKQTETLELTYTMTGENRTEKLNGELQKKTSLCRGKNLWPKDRMF